MLDLGRSPANLSYGSCSLRATQQPHLYCAARSLYLRRFLSRPHRLLCSKKFLLGCLTYKLPGSSGTPPSPFVLRRKLRAARGFVTQELTDKEESDGEDESGTLNIPTDLPWTVNSSLAVHNWGTIYIGPLEAKYFNLLKKFPYPIGYKSVKVYKGKQYCQSIEEGSQGPVFVVMEASLGKYKAESPQKVWSSVCGNSAIRVRGMRHFGFESSEVISVLHAMLFQSKDCSHKGSKQPVQHGADIAIRIDDSSSNSLAKDVTRKDCLLDTKFSGAEEVDDDADCIYASTDDVDNSRDNYGGNEYVEDESEFMGIGMIDDGQYDEEDVSVSAYTEENVDEIRDGMSYLDEKFDNDSQSNETNRFFSNVFSDDGEDTPGTRSSTSTRFKRSFKSGPRRVTFTKVSRDSHDHIQSDSIVHEPVKDDVKDESPMTPNVLYSHPYTSRQKTSLSADRQIWRKGEGLSGYIPSHYKVLGTDKVRVDQQGENLTGVFPGYFSQQAGRAAEQENLGRITDAYNGSRMSESFDNVSNAMKSQEGSVLEAKGGSSKSSEFLLKLLEKWNSSKDLDHEPRERPREGSLNMQEDVDFTNKLNLEGERPSSATGSGHASQAEGYLDEDESSLFNEQWSARNIDESTDFAVSKLFEIEAKPQLLWDEGGKLPSRHHKPTTLNVVKTVDHSIKRLNSANESKGIEVMFDSADFVSDITRGPMKITQIGVRIPNILRETRENYGKNVEPLEEIAHMTQRSAHDVGLIDDVRKLSANRSFESVLEKVKAMKLSGMTLMEDVYEAVLGFELDPWQKQVFRDVQDGNSVLVSAPSGAGKSAIADCCLFNNLVNEQRALFVTPYEHLATLNVHKFKSLLGESNVGGKWTSMRTQKSPKVLVITLEVLSKILHELNGTGGSEYQFFLEGVNMVVLDKFCTFSETKYGGLWEEVLMLLNPKIRVIALTLPATNEKRLAAWMSVNRGPCKVIRCRSEAVPKRHLFCCKDVLHPLLNPEGLQLNKKLSETKKNCGNFLWSGYDRFSLVYMLSVLEVNAMLPAIIVLLDVKSCDNVACNVLSDEIDNLLAREQIEDVDEFLKELESKHLDLYNHVDKTDCEYLRKGFAVYHEGKLPLWQDIVIELYQKSLVKVLIMTDNSLLQTEFSARTVIVSEICKVTQTGVSFITHSQLLQLIGRAGRRGFDIEGNVVFLESIASGPQDAASLLLDNTFSYLSCFKPSYSLVANLIAKYSILEVKRIISRSFAAFQYVTEYTKARKLRELDQEIFSCLESKADLDAKLFEGLMQVNKHKLLNAATFTRVDIRMAIHSVSQSGNVLPGILLAVIPCQTELFYMVFGADNNFRLVPAGALDHVYTTEVSPLDVACKESTGKVLLPPLIPPKESWTMDEVSSFGYIASGNSKTKEFVKLMRQYPVQPSIAKEGLQLRKDIFVLEAKLSNLIEKRKLLQTASVSLDLKSLKLCEAGAVSGQVDESEIWKELLRLIQTLERVDALFIIDGPGGYAKLKPLGMLISRLHNVENELWVAVAVTSRYVKVLSPADFAGFLATVMPLDPDMESLFTHGRELAYRVTRPLKDTLAGLDVLRRQVATVQGSCSPSLRFDTTFAGIVSAWTHGKPDTNGYHVISANDGDLAWRLRNIARFATLIHKACSQVSVDICDTNHHRNLYSLAKRAEDMLSRHLISVDRT